MADLRISALPELPAAELEDDDLLAVVDVSPASITKNIVASALRTLPLFATNKAYAQGDVVVRDGRLYKAKVNVAAGPFNAAEWSELDKGIPTGTTAPSPAVKGDPWIDTSGTVPLLRVNDGTRWVPVGALPTPSPTAPTSPTHGQLWSDTTGGAGNILLKAWNGTAWVTVNAEVTTQTLSLGTAGANVGEGYVAAGSPALTGTLVIATWGDPSAAYLLTTRSAPQNASSWTSLGGTVTFANQSQVDAGTEAGLVISPATLRGTSLAAPSTGTASSADADRFVRLSGDGRIDVEFIGLVPVAPHSHVIADIAGLQAVLDLKSNVGHKHVWADITDPPATYPPTAHGHAIADVTGLQAALDGKAASVHTHPMTQVDGLTTALDGKAPSVHTHAISQVTGLQAALDGKANATHAHAVSDVTGLQAALDGKQTIGVYAGVTDVAASREIADSDLGKLLVASADVTLTLDAETMAVGSRVDLIASGGKITVAVGGTKTVLSLGSKLGITTDGGAATLTKISSTQWHLGGSLE